MEEKDLEYVENYWKIYKRVIKEAKKRENDGYISNASNKSKAAWQVINKELGKSSISSKNIELNWGNNRISNPRVIAELFHSYFVEIVEKLAGQNSRTHATYNKFKISYMSSNNVHEPSNREWSRKSDTES